MIKPTTVRMKLSGSHVSANLHLSCVICISTHVYTYTRTYTHTHPCVDKLRIHKYVHMYAQAKTLSLSLSLYAFILPIISSRVSQKFYPLFLIYSHAITYYSLLLLKIKD